MPAEMAYSYFLWLMAQTFSVKKKFNKRNDLKQLPTG
jgi:hypothetical protein